MQTPSLAQAAIAALAVLTFARPAGAQQYESVGIRAQGMGGAFVAVADDASATWWNPAGLASGAYLDSLFEYGVLLEPEELRTPAGVVQPSVETRTRGIAFAFPAMGLSYYRLQISEIRPVSSTGGLAPSRESQGAAGLRVRSVVLSQYGATFGQSLSGNVVLASTLKLIRASVVSGVTTADAVTFEGVRELEGDADFHTDLDIGAMAIFGPLRMGAAVKNLRTPEIGPEEEAEELARRVRAGVAVTGSPAGIDLTVAFDADLTTAESPVFGETKNIAGGVEAWLWARRVGLRGGVSRNTVGEKQWRPSGGVSLALKQGTYIEGQYTAGPDKARKGWGFDMRVTF